jgi:hypothetical protein
VREAADPTKEADWASMKLALGLPEPILKLLPPNVQSQLREAEKRDEETKRRIANVPKVYLLEISMYFLLTPRTAQQEI